MFILRRPLLALVATLVAFSSFAVAPTADAQYFGRNKVRYDDFNFKILETEHFEIYYYPEMEQTARDVARMAERWYTRLSTALDHEYDERKSIILYADDADFRQTNITDIGQGTQGVTEGLRQRVVLPIASTYAETDHVLGHELVHQFQYDIAARNDAFQQFVRLPLFLIEGMAEYFSVGREDALTAMWMRDAVLRDDVPSLNDLRDNGRYNEYQYGQPFWAYIGGTYGDEAATRLFKTALQMPLDSALVSVTGISPDSLSSRWAMALKETLAPPARGRQAPRPELDPDELRERREDNQAYPDSLPRLSAQRLLARERRTGNLNIAPKLSPNGKHVAYLSERDLFGIDLFLADAESGDVLSKLESVGSNPHFDALRFIESAGAWSPDGRQFAYVVFSGGDNEIAILNVDSRSVRRRIGVRGVGAIKDPSWSPDGQKIVFGGVKGGITDLYMVDLPSGEVTQLTNDRYTDIQPAWHPNGREIAFVTDRGPGTDFDQLTYAPVRLAIYDTETAEIEVLSLFAGAKHINPDWSPDGESLFFISDQSGFNDIYRLERSTGDLFQVTNLATGISGIADLSPAFSVARETGALAYSVFEAQRYSVYRLAQDSTRGTPLSDSPQTPSGRRVAANRLPPVEAFERSPIEAYLRDARSGLPETRAFASKDYSPKLSLDYVSQPTAGAVYNPYFGSGVGIAGGVSMYFSDQLSDNVLGVALAANGTLKDIGGQGLYLNQSNRFTYGAQAGHVPYLQAFVGPDPDGSNFLTRYYYRTYISQLSGVGYYPLNQNQRLEAQIGGRRIGYDLDYTTLIDINGDNFPDSYGGTEAVPEEIVDRLGFNLDPLYLAEGGAAFVGDFSYFGFTSPIRGSRYRLGVDGTAGSVNYLTATADYRKYLFLRPPGFPRRLPVTLAFRGLHYARYGPDAGSGRLYPLYLGYGSLVRGYTSGSFPERSIGQPDPYNSFNSRLFGSKMAVANVELRLPLLGVSQLGLINFPYLPTELVAFADAGMAWGSVQRYRLLTDNGQETRSLGVPFSEQEPVLSAGISARVSVLGALILEPYYAFPFSRYNNAGDISSGGVWGLNLTPGW